MKFIGIALVPLAFSKQKRETWESQENILPSAFWEPSAQHMLTTATTTGESIRTYLGEHAKDMLNHGCHCSQLHNPHHNPKEPMMDEYDFACAKWRAARNCIYLEGGPCHGVERAAGTQYTVTNGVCREDHDTCAGAACIIDIFHQRIMNMELIYKQNFEHKGCNPAEANFDPNAIISRSLAVAGETTEAELAASSEKGTYHNQRNNLLHAIIEKQVEKENHLCCGIAPRFTKYDRDSEVCHNDGSVHAMNEEDASANRSAEDEAIAGDILDLDHFGTSQEEADVQEEIDFGDGFF